MTLSVIKLKSGNIGLSKQTQEREELFVAQAIEIASKGDLRGLIQLRKVYESTPDVGTFSPNTLIAIDKAIQETATRLQKDSQIVEKFKAIEQELGTLEQAIKLDESDYSIGKSYQFQKGKAEFVQKLSSPIVKTCCGVTYELNFAGVQVSCIKCGKPVTTDGSRADMLDGVRNNKTMPSAAEPLGTWIPQNPDGSNRYR